MTLQIPGRSGNGKGGGGRVCIGETELNRYLMPQTEKKANDKDLILFQGMGINTKITAKKKKKPEFASGEGEIRRRMWGLCFFNKYL